MFYLSFTANIYISTHTLRGERDTPRMLCAMVIKFQLTRSVGSVTYRRFYTADIKEISTHTLRGERDPF